METKQTEQNRTPKSKRWERGAGLVEYALLVALISIVSMAAVRTLGLRTNMKMQQAADALTGGFTGE